LTQSLQEEGCREPLSVWLDPSITAWCEACNETVSVEAQYSYVVPESHELEWFLVCGECGRWLDALTDRPEEEGDLTPCLLLDGHNRHAICEAHNIHYDVRIIADVHTREDARIWIMRNQLARRNLSDIDRVALALQLKPLLDAQAKVRQGTRTDLLPNLAESPEKGTTTRQALADLASVSHGTLDKAQKILTQGAPEVIQATRTKDLSLHAALPLTNLPEKEQAKALEDAKREAGGGKPTATQTKALVTRAQVVATVKEQLAAGQTPQAAVAHALQKHEITTPTPALADAICQATDRQVTLAATDGLLHDGRTKAEEAAAAAETTRLFQLFNALHALATLPDIPALVTEIPDYSAYRVDQDLAQATTNLQTFGTLWEERTRERTASA
jgi:hypothetical protein